MLFSIISKRELFHSAIISIRGMVMIRVRIRLSILLGEKKWTQARLARKTHIRPNTISDLYWEIADRINLSHLARICEALGCSLDEILTLEYIESDVIDEDSRGNPMRSNRS